MPLPFLNAPEQSINMIEQFGGYNHNLIIPENQFYDMKNMSSRCFPMISTRKKRGIFTNDELYNANAIVAKDNIIFSFTGYGDIGVSLAENLEKTVWVEPPVNEDVGSEDSDAQMGITTIATYNNNDLTKKILGKSNNVNEFSRYIYSNGAMSPATGKSPVIKEDKLMMEWEHEAIPAGTLWAKNLFTVEYVYQRDNSIVGDGDKTIIAVKTNAQLKDKTFRDVLTKSDLWINNQKVRVLKIEEKSLLWMMGDWKITLDLVDSSDYPKVKKGDNAVLRLIEPIEKEIPEAKFVVTEDEGTQPPINQPTKVLVNAESDMHVKVLKGKTVTFVDENGNHECYISGYEIKDGKRRIIVDCPNDAVSSGAKAYGDRLYLCEYNPFENKTIVSDIFSAASGKHTLIEMGGYVVIFPEKVMVNTQKRSADGRFVEIQPLEMSQVINKCFMRLTDVNGNGFVENGKEKCSVGNTAPEKPEDGYAWIDTSEKPPALKIYSKQIEQWAKTQPYCEIRIPDGVLDSISDDWQIGDAVELEFEEDDIIGNKIVPMSDEQKYFVISSMKGSDDTRCIRFPAAMNSAITNTDKKLTIKRTVPDMDFVIENENRLWGCKYGEVDGEPINEIFACKLGDPKNWHSFANTSMDSYYVSLGADGEFTGAVSYAGSPFFFREGCVHRIYGNYPSNYMLKTVNCHGVEKGSEKGIAIMNDTMFYKSPVGIMAYTGASPVLVSDFFGTERYKNAVASAVGNKMYFSMQDMNGNDVFFCFDDLIKAWYKEDNLRCKDMVVFENDVYALTSYNELVVINGEEMLTDGDYEVELEDDFEWSITSGNIGYNNPFFKHIARINIRMMLETTSVASVYIQYDSDGNWLHISNLEARGKVANLSIPVIPHRCDHFALKIEGKGEAKMLSMTKFTEGGSENE